MTKYQKLIRKIHNPLLLTEGVNRYNPSDRFLWGVDKIKEETAALEVFWTEYDKALTQAKTEDICFGLDYDFVDTDQGYGGFYSAGFIPYAQQWGDFESGMSEEDFKHYWPKDFFNPDKYRSYLGGINLGVWANVFHNLTVVKESEWSKKSLISYGTSSLEKTTDSWMNFWCSSDNHFDNLTPDCNVSITHVDFELVENEADKESFRTWQKERCVTPIVKTPKKFFSVPRLKFFYDRPDQFRKAKDLAKLDLDNMDDIFKYRYGDLQVFGAPRSQQIPKRFISPDSYQGARGLIPAVAFDDAESDVTHQFYADLLLGSTYIFKTNHYCKLESSNT